MLFYIYSLDVECICVLCDQLDGIIFKLKRDYMGLDYLNKKIWHPGSMKNIQKVWEVEQTQKEINKKNRERAKKLLQEQHNDDLKRIQVQAGLIPRSHLDRMDWMYDWGNKINQQKTNEELLTGKQAAKPGQFKAVYQQQITNRKCQDFQLLHEDPMYEIMKQQKVHRDAIMNNPMQMRNIIKEVQKEYLPHDFEQRKKKHFSSKRRRSTSSSSDSRRNRRHKKSKRESSRSSSKERQKSRSKDRKQSNKDSKSSYKQSKLYKQYYVQNFGGIVKQDEDGNLKPDYSIHKPKYRTQYQLDKQQVNKKMDELRQNRKRLQESRGKQATSRRQQQNKPQDYEQGAAKIRKTMLHGVKQNRNHKKYKNSDSD